METTMDSKTESKVMINKDMTIGEVVRMFPDTVPVMLENGIHCVGCHVAHWETLEQGFRGHYGMDDEKLNAFIAHLNEVAAKSSSLPFGVSSEAAR